MRNVARYVALCAVCLQTATACHARMMERDGWTRITDTNHFLIQRLTGEWVSVEYAYGSIAADFQQSLKRLSFGTSNIVSWETAFCHDMFPAPHSTTSSYSVWHDDGRGYQLYLASPNGPGPWSDDITLLWDLDVQTNWFLVGDVLSGVHHDMFPIPVFFIRESAARFLPTAGNQKRPPVAPPSNGNIRHHSMSLVVCFLCGCAGTLILTRVLQRRRDSQPVI